MCSLWWCSLRGCVDCGCVVDGGVYSLWLLPVGVWPVVVKTGAVKPVVAQPTAVQPVAVQPVIVQPMGVQHVAVQPVGVQLDCSGNLRGSGSGWRTGRLFSSCAASNSWKGSSTATWAGSAGQVTSTPATHWTAGARSSGGQRKQLARLMSRLIGQVLSQDISEQTGHTYMYMIRPSSFIQSRGGGCTFTMFTLYICYLACWSIPSYCTIRSYICEHDNIPYR